MWLSRCVGRIPRATARSTWARISRSASRSEEHTSELQSQSNLVCRLLLEKKKISLFASVLAGELGTPSLRCVPEQYILHLASDPLHTLDHPSADLSLLAYYAFALELHDSC